MINILTLHFGTPAWLEIQKRHITKNTNGDYKVWLGTYANELPAEFVLPENWEHIDLDKIYPPEGKNEHYLQVEWMYKNILKQEMSDDDILIFMDSDAFPCSLGWEETLSSVLLSEEESGHDVLCLLQAENRGISQPDEYYPYPDLCFFATTKKVWEENNLEWGLFTPAHQNPGFGLMDRLREANLKIGAITRTNKFNANNVMFGVYGDIIYHQACGSRAIIGRPLATAGSAPNKERQCYTGQDLLGRIAIGNWHEQEFENECKDIITANTQIFDIIYDKLAEDKESTFVRRYFMGMP